MEQTGTTIFQTFAGIYLDKNSPSKSGDGLPKGPLDNLLRSFVFLNVLQLIGICGLWGLDCRRKRQAQQIALITARSNTDPPDEVVMADSDIDDEQSPNSPKSNRLSFTKVKRIAESHSLQRRDSVLELMTGVGSSSRVGETNETNESEEEERPLLGEEMNPIIRPKLQSKEAEVEIGVARSRGEVLRGEIFGILGICAIIFAWAFFILTALHRLRSKEDRLVD